MTGAERAARRRSRGSWGSDYSSRSTSMRRRASRSAAYRWVCARRSRRDKGVVGASGSHAPDAALFRQRRRRARGARARRARTIRSPSLHSICRSTASDFFPSAARRGCCGSGFATVSSSCAAFTRALVARDSVARYRNRTHEPFTPHLTLARFRDRVPARETRRNSRYSSLGRTVADRSCYFVRKPPVAGGTDVYPARGSAA